MRIKNGFIAALCVVLTGSLFAPLFADEGGGMMDGHAGWHERGEHWKKMMGFTDEQMTKLKTLRETREKALKPSWRKERDLMIKLKDRLEDKASDSDIKAILTDLRTNKEAIDVQSKHFREDEDAILTPTQRARMMLMHHHRGGMHGHHEGMEMGMDKGHHDGHDGHDGDGRDDGEHDK